MTRSRTALATAPSTLIVAAADTPSVDVEARTITGLAVPYGPAGQTSAGRLTFARGALRWTDPRRVKLLIEHDQHASIGYATALEDTDDGLRATFYVPEGEAGDQALAAAANGTRDGLSVGVQLDDAVMRNLASARGRPVAGAGALRETSLVAIPAFDDARVAASLSALVVSSWHHEPTPSPGDTMTDTATVDATASATDTPPSDQPTTTAGQDQQAQQTRPATVAAAAGAAVTAEPAVYRFDGTGPSLARDVFAARDRGDSEAVDRLTRFSAALAAGDPAQDMALAAVIETDTPNSSAIIPPGYRPNLTITAVDRGRPLVSRAGVRVTLTDATPFTIPVVGDFEGVGTHVEGTAHVAEGTQTLSERTVTPRSKSGAARVSREMVDASNPAIDRIIVAQMLRDFQRETEADLWAVIAAAAGAPTNDINTVMELRAQLINFAAANNGQPADFVGASSTYFSTLASEVAGDGRPALPFVGPMNAVGTIRAGYTGASIDGTEIVNAYSVDATEAVLVRADALLHGEGRLQTFRFDEVEGPGVIKFALWAYTADAVLDTAGVDLVQSDAV